MPIIDAPDVLNKWIIYICVCVCACMYIYIYRERIYMCVCIYIYISSVISLLAYRFQTLYLELCLDYGKCIFM